MQLLTIDPHGPNPNRCNGPLSNMEEFHEAFDVPEDSVMFIAKGQRVDIWWKIDEVTNHHNSRNIVRENQGTLDTAHLWHPYI